MAYQYATKTGELKTFEARDSASALNSLKGFMDADPNSGVMEVKPLAPIVPTAPTTPFNTSKINAGDIQNLPQMEQEASAQQKAIADYKALQEQTLAQTEPTSTENALETQLADIRAKSEEGLINTKYDIRDLSKEGISSVGIGARGKELTTEESRNQEILASQEKQLASRLGIEVKKREGKWDKLKTAMGFAKEDIDMQQDIKTAIDKQNNAVQAQAEKLSDNARQTLTTMLSQFKGLDFEDLDQDAQLQVQMLATQSEMPLGVLQSGMKAVKDQMANNEAQENRRIAISAQNAGK